MEPVFCAHERVLVNAWSKVSPGDHVVCRAEGRILLKKIAYKEADRFFVVGENRAASTDSHDFGWIAGSAILGKVVLKY